LRIRKLALAAAVATAAAGTLGVPAVHAALTDESPSTESKAPKRPTRDSLHDDFNGDGYTDLVTATPSATVGGQAKAGNVVVQYGSADGISTSRSTTVTQGAHGVPDAPETGDRFGADFSSGDLDGDGFDDLVVTADEEKVDRGTRRTGSVTVVWGGKKGLTNGGTLVTGDKDKEVFGTDVAVADIDGDKGQNLVVLNGFGGNRMLTYADGFSRDKPSRATSVTDGFEDGMTSYNLTTGDFTGSGSDDIVVSSSQEADADDFSQVNVYRGGPAGVTFQRELTDGWMPYSYSGGSGDLNKDGYEDLVLGGVGEGNDERGNPSGGAGHVAVWYGTKKGLTSKHKFIHPETPGFPGKSGSTPEFGASVSVGDVTGDGYDDVAAGMPGKKVSGDAKSGGLVLLKGSADGLTTKGVVSLNQDTKGVPGMGETGDKFGSAVRVTDIDGDGRSDVAISAKGEDVTPGAKQDGAVWTLRGAADGLTTKGATSFSAPKFGFTFRDQKFGSDLGYGNSPGDEWVPPQSG